MSSYPDHIKFYAGIKNETFYSKEEIKERITDDYLRGLIEGEGHFGIDTKVNGEKIPCFVLKMHVRDKELIEAVRDHLGVRNRVYEYTHQGRHFAQLIIRDIPTLKFKTVPMFHRKVLGFKGTQIEWWLSYFPYLRQRIN